MYSVQHVLWRGVMALSLLVVGGVGAGVSPQAVPAAHDDAYACEEDAAFVFNGVKGAFVSSQFAVVRDARPLQVFDVVVVKAIPPMPDEA